METKIPKGLVKKQKELLKRKYGRCWLIPITAEWRIGKDRNQKTARNRAEYFYKTGNNKDGIFEIGEKLLENF